MPPTNVSPHKKSAPYVKRPENAFILFRRQRCLERVAPISTASMTVKRPRQADLSKVISQEWKRLPTEERRYWEELAKERKQAHERAFPDYSYSP
ncbi:high mobility group box domain-containing protein, partial [Flagelloscypha sp. PMI_526]